MNDANSSTRSIKARRVLVPLANPATAQGLLRMAWNLCDHEEGRVIALYVTLGDTDREETTIERLTAVVEQAGASGMSIELITRAAPSIARGVLDAATEQGATLIVLGFQAPVRGKKIEIGAVVESVARTTPCDLVVFRNPSHAHIELEEVKRIIIPLDGSDNSRVAARLGLVLARVYDADPVAIHVQTDPDLPSWYGLARIEASLARLDPADARQVQRQVIHAQDAVQGIIARVDAEDMVVIGFSERSPLDRWIFGDVAQRTLAQAPGPVILAKEAMSEELSATERLSRRLMARFSPRLTPSERTEVLRHASELSIRGINFYVLMVLSALLASFGLLQNSAAVIIGAMLVAPLMSPLMAFSVGLLQGQLRMLRDATLTVVTGVGIGMLVAMGIGLVFPVDVPTNEMLLRGEPSLLDLGVALASGAAGAYAMARKDIPAALAGVAIAAALVPPLCTVGLAVAFGAGSLAVGSALLFATNIVSISLAGAGIFLWLGLRPGSQVATMRNWVISLVVLGVLAVPLVRAFVGVVRLEQQMSTARSVLEEQFESGEVLDINVKTGDPLDVRATIRSTDWITSRNVQDAQDALIDALDRDVTLEITNWRAITP